VCTVIAWKDCSEYINSRKCGTNDCEYARTADGTTYCDCKLAQLNRIGVETK
jgi:hypothetical protein